MYKVYFAKLKKVIRLFITYPIPTIPTSFVTETQVHGKWDIELKICGIK